MAFAALRAMVKKDILIFFSDRKAVIMSFIAPIAIASFFGFIFAGHRREHLCRQYPRYHHDHP